MASPLQTPSTWEVRLSELLSLSVQVQWPEAVAVVRRVAMEAGGTAPLSLVPSAAATRGGDDDTALVWPPPAAELDALEFVDTIHGIPDPSGIWLRTDGTVRLEVAVGTHEQVVTRLGILLKALLPMAAPSDLLQLAEPENSAVKSSARKFLEQLTYFARPDDSREIRALVARVLEARLAEERTRTLHALTERARHVIPLPEPPAHVTRKPLPLSRLLTVAGCVAATFALSSALWIFVRSSDGALPQGQAPTTKPPPSAARLVHDKLATAASIVREAFGGRSEHPRVARADLPVTVPTRGDAGRPKSRPVPRSPSPTVATDSGPPFESRGATGAPPERNLSAAAGMPDALASSVLGIYTSAHPDVVPPALVRPQMPEVPIRGVPITGMSVLVLVVDVDGLVVSARLVPNSNRYQDRMMVSAAKTWRFSPARRYGQPVQYVLKMPVTW